MLSVLIALLAIGVLSLGDVDLNRVRKRVSLSGNGIVTRKEVHTMSIQYAL